MRKRERKRKRETERERGIVCNGFAIRVSERVPEIERWEKNERVRERDTRRQKYWPRYFRVESQPPSSHPLPHFPPLTFPPITL